MCEASAFSGYSDSAGDPCSLGDVKVLPDAWEGADRDRRGEARSDLSAKAAFPGPTAPTTCKLRRPPCSGTLCETPVAEKSVRAERFIGWGGVTLVADVGGPQGGAPVMLMHGGGQTRGAWKKAATALAAAGYYAISLDLRGHGESDWAGDANYSLDAFAADLRAVASTLSHPPALVGASLGGMSALLAMGAGLAARALILVDI